MKWLIAGVLIVALWVPAGFADTDDDTLRFYLSKSELVVTGEITTEPSCYTREAGVPEYSCEFKIAEVLKGDDILNGETIRVTIRRFESGPKDRHPLVEQGAECILFLDDTERGHPAYVTADFWFGVQRPSASLVRSLKRLTEEQATRTPAETDDDKLQTYWQTLVHFDPFRGDAQEPHLDHVVPDNPQMLPVSDFRRYTMFQKYTFYAAGMNNYIVIAVFDSNDTLLTYFMRRRATDATFELVRGNERNQATIVFTFDDPDAAKQFWHLELKPLSVEIR